jgi:phospholipase/lecithinase/hemolysin
MRTLAQLLLLTLLALPFATLTGCSVVPKEANRASFVQEAHDGLAYFKENVSNLDGQIAQSAGYAVFTPNGTQIGWAAVNNFNVGLQAGGQGKKILIVFADAAVLKKFQDGLLTGSASGLAVAGESGSSGTAPFQNGLAVYVGAQKGLMAGGMIGMENFRYRPLEAEDAPAKQ